MNISGLVRLTSDATMQTTKSGKSLMQIKAVVNNGFGENQRAVWIDAVMFGDRGEKLVQYLKKGQQVVLHCDQVEADSYQGKDGIQNKLKMNIINIELLAKPSEQQATKQYAQPSPSAAIPNANDFDFSDSIPF